MTASIRSKPQLRLTNKEVGQAFDLDMSCVSVI
jgi:hypothetical protein